MASTGTISSALGQQQFLNLLVAQLQNQDPMDPVSQQDSIAQLAQFSQLEGIETLNANFSSFMKLQQLTQGSNLVGKKVDWVDKDGNHQTGIVEKVTVTDGKMNVKIENQAQEVPIDNVVGVIDG